MIRRTISVEESMWEQAKEAVKRKGWTISFLLRELLRMWLEGKVSIQE